MGHVPDTLVGTPLERSDCVYLKGIISTHSWTVGSFHAFTASRTYEQAAAASSLVVSPVTNLTEPKSDFRSKLVVTDSRRPSFS